VRIRPGQIEENGEGPHKEIGTSWRKGGEHVGNISDDSCAGGKGGGEKGVTPWDEERTEPVQRSNSAQEGIKGRTAALIKRSFPNLVLEGGDLVGETQGGEVPMGGLEPVGKWQLLCKSY